MKRVAAGWFQEDWESGGHQQHRWNHRCYWWCHGCSLGPQFSSSKMSSEMLRTWQFYAQCLCHSLPTGGDMGMEIDIEKVGLVQCFGSLHGMCPVWCREHATHIVIDHRLVQASTFPFRIFSNCGCIPLWHLFKAGSKLNLRKMIISKCNIKGILASTEPIWIHTLHARVIAGQDVDSFVTWLRRSFRLA